MSDSLVCLNECVVPTVRRRRSFVRATHGLAAPMRGAARFRNFVSQPLAAGVSVDAAKAADVTRLGRPWPRRRGSYIVLNKVMNG
ncbi:hypothetical protein [Pseudomonas sp. CGJS7]|uniref:hypothetical protein n=1 Tax=Pseudomonas sp. CGJS7 TaxID=3109348 RepID=UPI00300A6712